MDDGRSVQMVLNLTALSLIKCLGRRESHPKVASKILFVRRVQLCIHTITYVSKFSVFR